MKKEYFHDFPFIYLNFDNLEALKEIANRAVLLKHFILPFGEGATYDELINNIDYDGLK